MSALFTPDDFTGDWYGWLANQSGHIFLGILFAVLAAGAGAAVLGEFPTREGMWLGITSCYLCWEVRRQSWQGWDTIEDCMFVCVYGAGAVLYAFHEMEPGSTLICADLRDFAPFVAMACLHLLAGAIVRMRNARKRGDV